MTAAAAADDGRFHRGDQRRARLLEALDELLLDHGLEAITVADITARAGVTRSAFYFYFESKAAAVAALTADMYAQATEASRALYTGDAPPRVRLESMVRGLVDAWRDHHQLYRAMLEARHSDDTVRAHWDAGRRSFIRPVSEVIDHERASGAAPPGPDSTALATVLLELNDRCLEELARGEDLDPDHRLDALVTIWLRAIYATEPA